MPEVYLVEMKAHRYLGAYAGYGIAGRFRGKGGGARHAGIDLDKVIVEREGIEGELHIAAPFDLKGAYEFERRIAQELVFLIGKGLGRSHHD